MKSTCITFCNRFLSLDVSSVSVCFFFFSSRRRHTRFDCDWSSDVCSSDFNALSLIPNVTFGGGGTSASAGFGISNDPQVNFYTRFPFNNNTGTWEYTDGLTKIWNNHTTKFGAYWQNGRYVQHPIGNQFKGTFSFNGSPAKATDAGYA